MNKQIRIIIIVNTIKNPNPVMSIPTNVLLDNAYNIPPQITSTMVKEYNNQYTLINVVDKAKDVSLNTKYKRMNSTANNKRVWIAYIWVVMLCVIV